MAHKTVEDLFVRYPVQAGETYFVEAGTQHAILPGMIVCEIQEYSDLTYRVYDYGRVDAHGKSRELHLEKALEVTRFDGTHSGKIPPLSLYSPDANKHLLAACEFFATERWDCDRTTPIESDPSEFQLIVILNGRGKLYEPELSHRLRGRSGMVHSRGICRLRCCSRRSRRRFCASPCRTRVALHAQLLQHGI